MRYTNADAIASVAAKREPHRYARRGPAIETRPGDTLHINRLNPRGCKSARGHSYPIMPRKHATLVAAAQRVVEARRIVADQEALIANLRAAKRPTADAEAALYTYLSAPRHLEDRERKIKEGLKAKIGETRKQILD